MIFIKYETFIIETKVEVKIKYLFSKVTIIVAIDKQLNELATIKITKIKTTI